MAIEQLIRIFAGAFVPASLALGVEGGPVFVHQNFLWFTAFVGAPERLDFTVIGPAVNRAARLESMTKKLGVPLLMTGAFAGRLDRPVRSLGAHRMKGLSGPIEVFALDSLAPSGS